MAERLLVLGRERDTLRTQLGGGNTAGASVLVSLWKGCTWEQAGPWLQLLSLGHMWVPEPLETALGCRQPTPRDLGLPTSVYLCSKPTPRTGSWATHGLFHQKLQKTAPGPVPPPPAPSRQRYSNLQRSPSLVPHPPGRGAKAVAQLVLCRALGVQGPRNCCSRPPLS